MPYNPYAYQNNYQMYPTYQQQMANNQANAVPQNVQTPQLQIQNGGFVSVHNETEARNYPIAIGTSIIFKDENAPYLYTKTMGFSQLESPKFEKYRLDKEEPTEQPQMIQNEAKEPHACHCNVEKLEAKIEALENEIDTIKKKLSAKPTANSKKKEAEEDES